MAGRYWILIDAKKEWPALNPSGKLFGGRTSRLMLCIQIPGAKSLDCQQSLMKMIRESLGEAATPGRDQLWWILYEKKTGHQHHAQRRSQVRADVISSSIRRSKARYQNPPKKKYSNVIKGRREKGSLPLPQMLVERERTPTAPTLEEWKRKVMNWRILLNDGMRVFLFCRILIYTHGRCSNVIAWYWPSLSSTDSSATSFLWKRLFLIFSPALYPQWCLFLRVRDCDCKDIPI